MAAGSIGPGCSPKAGDGPADAGLDGEEPMGGSLAHDPADPFGLDVFLPKGRTTRSKQRRQQAEAEAAELGQGVAATAATGPAAADEVDGSSDAEDEAQRLMEKTKFDDDIQASLEEAGKMHGSRDNMVQQPVLSLHSGAAHSVSPVQVGVLLAVANHDVDEGSETAARAEERAADEEVVRG